MRIALRRADSRLVQLDAVGHAVECEVFRQARMIVAIGLERDKARHGVVPGEHRGVVIPAAPFA